jgi:hypothetical protein
MAFENLEKFGGFFIPDFNKFIRAGRSYFIIIYKDDLVDRGFMRFPGVSGFGNNSLLVVYWIRGMISIGKNYFVFRGKWGVQSFYIFIIKFIHKFRAFRSWILKLENSLLNNIISCFIGFKRASGISENFIVLITIFSTSKFILK